MEIRTTVKVLQLKIYVKESVWLNKTPEKTTKKNEMKSEEPDDYANIWPVSRLEIVVGMLKLDSDFFFSWHSCSDKGYNVYSNILKGEIVPSTQELL